MSVQSPALNPRDKAVLAIEILRTYLEVRRLLRRSPLPGIVERLRRPQASPRRPLAEVPDGVRLGRAVDRMLARPPINALCLMRSLVLLGLLARRGAEGRLVIAVRPGTAEPFGAHAWIELEGRPILRPAGEDFGRLLTL